MVGSRWEYLSTEFQEYLKESEILAQWTPLDTPIEFFLHNDSIKNNIINNVQFNYKCTISCNNKAYKCMNTDPTETMFHRDNFQKLFVNKCK